jgi:hypothetical protein
LKEEETEPNLISSSSEPKQQHVFDSVLGAKRKFVKLTFGSRKKKRQQLPQGILCLCKSYIFVSRKGNFLPLKLLFGDAMENGQEVEKEEGKPGRAISYLV